MKQRDCERQVETILQDCDYQRAGDCKIVKTSRNNPVTTREPETT